MKQNPHHPRLVDRRRFNAKQWVDGEVLCLMDLYGGTRQYQLQFILDMISEREYEDTEISFIQQGLIAAEARRQLQGGA